MKFVTKQYDITHLTLGMLLHYLGKLKIQILCRYSAYMEEKCKQIASLLTLTLLFIHKFDISVFKIARFPSGGSRISVRGTMEGPKAPNEVR